MFNIVQRAAYVHIHRQAKLLHTHMELIWVFGAESRVKSGNILYSKTGINRVLTLMNKDN